MKTLWCKNQENPSDQISHAWAPLKKVLFNPLYTAEVGFDLPCHHASPPRIPLSLNMYSFFFILRTRINQSLLKLKEKERAEQGSLAA
jgi:hypothetical protein